MPYSRGRTVRHRSICMNTISAGVLYKRKAVTFTASLQKMFWLLLWSSSVTFWFSKWFPLKHCRQNVITFGRKKRAGCRKKGLPLSGLCWSRLASSLAERMSPSRSRDVHSLNYFFSLRSPFRETELTRTYF